MVREIYMSRAGFDSIVNELHESFGIEVALCEVFKRRWSFISGTDGFISGQHKLQLNEEYGIIINCKDDHLDEIKNLLIKRGLKLR